MTQALLDLGQVHGPLLLFGGAYSNLAATRAMREAAAQRGIPPDHCICTGDIIAYCAQPSETLELIRDWGVHVVMGNCEESLATSAPDCGCGFDDGSACSLLADDWYRFSSQRIVEEQRTWMGNLPRQISFELVGKRGLVVHGTPRRINEFIFPSTSARDKSEMIRSSGVDLIVGGHCGVAFGQLLEQGAWLNSGAIGMPANDGTRRGWYLLLEPTGAAIEASWHPLIYDIDKTLLSMRENGLDNGYARSVETGLWPSVDVLPEAERALTGLPLSPPPLSIC